jgi:hypothetical protein
MWLSRFLHALLYADKKPAELDILVETMMNGTFGSFTSPKVLTTSFQKARTLVLRMSTVLSSRNHGDVSYTYVLSNALLPNMTHLIIECTPRCPRKADTSPTSLALPNLTHLTLRASCMTSVEELSRDHTQPHHPPQVYHMISASQSLKHLTLINLIGGPWDPFLAYMASKGLDRLDIELEEHFCDARTRTSKATITVPKRDVLFATAASVQLSHEYRMMCKIAWSHNLSQEIIVGALGQHRTLEYSDPAQLRRTPRDLYYVPTWRDGPCLLTPGSLGRQHERLVVKKPWHGWKMLLGDWSNFYASTKSNYLR